MIGTSFVGGFPGDIRHGGRKMCKFIRRWELTPDLNHWINITWVVLFSTLFNEDSNPMLFYPLKTKRMIEVKGNKQDSFRSMVQNTLHSLCLLVYHSLTTENGYQNGFRWSHSNLHLGGNQLETLLTSGPLLDLTPKDSPELDPLGSDRREFTDWLSLILCYLRTTKIRRSITTKNTSLSITFTERILYDYYWK